MSSSAKVAPVTRMDSPSAMMTNRPPRFSHMRAFDGPVRRRRAAQHRDPVARYGCDSFDPTGDRPKRQPGLRVGESAGNPERCGDEMPDADAYKIAIIANVVPAQGPQHEHIATGVHTHIRERKGERPILRTLSGSRRIARGHPASA